jgi:DNA-binding response OmpR family regulator
MPASKILVVEDSDAIRVPLVAALSGHGFEVAAAADGTGLESTLGTFSPDLVILDVMLPGRDGFELLGVIRRSCSAGVVMLTARDGVADRVQGLTRGADDYVLKPFALVELIARVLAVLRRVRPGGGTVAVGDLLINEDVSVVRRDDQLIELTETERRVLSYLAGQQGRVVSKTQILTAVWGYDGFDENLVEVHVSSLRRKLEAGGARVVHTVRGRGYLLGVQP